MFLWLLIIGGVGALILAFMAMRGPSPSKSLKRRMELIKERHGDIAGNAQAQIRRLFAERASKFEGYASTLIPKPALLRKRLDRPARKFTWQICDHLHRGYRPDYLCPRPIGGAPFLLSLLLGLFFGIGGPHFVIGRLIKRRVSEVHLEFPRRDRAYGPRSSFGSSDHQTLGIVASEIPGPVGVEFRMVSDKMKIGRTMEAALQDTADRLGTPEFQFFVITLAIQRETGGNLAETLSNLADVLRKRAQMKLKIRAMSSESKASAYIVGSLPLSCSPSCG